MGSSLSFTEYWLGDSRPVPSLCFPEFGEPGGGTGWAGRALQLSAQGLPTPASPCKSHRGGPPQAGTGAQGHSSEPPPHSLPTVAQETGTFGRGAQSPRAQALQTGGSGFQASQASPGAGLLRQQCPAGTAALETNQGQKPDRRTRGPAPRTAILTATPKQSVPCRWTGAPSLSPAALSRSPAPSPWSAAAGSKEERCVCFYLIYLF